MGFFKQLLSAPTMIQTITDAAIKSGDALVFTPEEQSQANQKRLDWLLKFHEASSGSNVARRILALSVTYTFLLIVLLMVGCVLFKSTGRLAGFKDVLEYTELPWLVIAIFAFYFGSRMVPKK